MTPCVFDSTITITKEVLDAVKEVERYAITTGSRTKLPSSLNSIMRVVKQWTEEERHPISSQANYFTERGLVPSFELTGGMRA